MIDRRRFLAIGALGSAALFTPWAVRGRVDARPLLDAGALPKWVQPFPKPPVFMPGTLDGIPYYQIPITPATAEILPGVGTPIWGYGGTFPGASIEAFVGQPIAVRWYNHDLPSAHLLPVDPTLHGTDMGEPEVRTVTHFHGGHVPAHSDGYPEAWYDHSGTPNPHTRPGRPAPRAIYTYPNTQEGATFWYHDHALGITRLNVYAGLAGFYLLRDPGEASLNLPSGAHEIPIVIQDRTFHEDGSLFYPSEGMNGVNPVWVPEFFGDVPVVNGKAWPYYQVEPRKYRLRILNGSTSRFYNVQLLRRGGSGRPAGPGPVMIQIGTDGGFLPAPVSIALASSNNPGRLLLGPGERADVIVDFSDYAGQRLVLHNNAPTPFSGSASARGGFGPFTGRRHAVGGTIPLDEVLEFRVGSGPVADSSVIPASIPLATYTAPVVAPGTPVRDLTLDELLAPNGMPLVAVVEDASGAHTWDVPINTTPIAAGSQEVWRFINVTEDTHPMHVHLVQFRILWRRAFNVNRYLRTGEIAWAGPPIPPDANERGWKDTVRANPGEVTALLMDFTVHFSGDLGYYPVHCHILEHEDHEMMREFEIW